MLLKWLQHVRKRKLLIKSEHQPNVKDKETMFRSCQRENVATTCNRSPTMVNPLESTPHHQNRWLK